MQTLRRSGQTKGGVQLNFINIKDSSNNMANSAIPVNDVSFYTNIYLGYA